MMRTNKEPLDSFLVYLFNFELIFDRNISYGRQRQSLAIGKNKINNVRGRHCQSLWLKRNIN